MCWAGKKFPSLQCFLVMQHALRLGKCAAPYIVSQEQRFWCEVQKCRGWKALAGSSPRLRESIAAWGRALERDGGWKGKENIVLEETCLHPQIRKQLLNGYWTPQLLSTQSPQLCSSCSTGAELMSCWWQGTPCLPSSYSSQTFLLLVMLLLLLSSQAPWGLFGSQKTRTSSMVLGEEGCSPLEGPHKSHRWKSSFPIPAAPGQWHRLHFSQ